jgi:hypothetical protein
MITCGAHPVEPLLFRLRIGILREIDELDFEDIAHAHFDRGIVRAADRDLVALQVLDRGEAIVIGEEDGKWIKLKLKGRKLKGLLFMAQQEGSRMWTFQKSKLPEPV